MPLIFQFSSSKKEKKKTETLNFVTQMSTNERKIKGGVKFHFFIRAWSFITEMTEARGGGVHESRRAQNTTGKRTLLQPDVLSRDGCIITPSATKQVNVDTGRTVAIATVPAGIRLPPTHSYCYQSNCPIHTVSSALLEL